MTGENTLITLITGENTLITLITGKVRETGLQLAALTRYFFPFFVKNFYKCVLWFSVTLESLLQRITQPMLVTQGSLPAPLAELEEMLETADIISSSPNLKSSISCGF